MKDLISIIVPVYNGQEYLERCLNSILNQKYDLWECILLDDGSRDLSGEICDTYGDKDKRFKVIHKENSGVSDTRNYGLKIAKGKYVVFIDCDDYVDENYIYELYKNMVSAGADMSACGYIINEDKGFKYSERKSILNRNEALEFMFLSKGFKGYISNKMYSKKIIDKYNIKFNQSIKYCEDLLFNYEYISRCNKFIYIYSVLFFYYQSKNSATNSRKYGRSFNENWMHFTDAYDILLKKIPDEQKKLREMVRVEKFRHVATNVRLMARFSKKDCYEYSEFREYLKKNIFEYILSNSVGMKQKLGGLITLISPEFSSKIW